MGAVKGPELHNREHKVSDSDWKFLGVLDYLSDLTVVGRDGRLIGVTAGPGVLQKSDQNRVLEGAKRQRLARLLKTGVH